MRVLVVGGGIGGLTVAAGLQQRGVEVRVFEAQAAPMFINAGIFIGINAVRSFARIGLSEAVEARGERVQRTTLLNTEGETLGEMDFSDLSRRYGLAVAIHRGRLLEILLEAVGPDCVRYGSRVVAIEAREDAVWVEDLEGRTEVYDLVIGADGAHSSVRKLVFGGVGAVYAGATSWRFVTQRPDLINHPVEIWGKGMRLGLMPLDGEFVHCVAVAQRKALVEDPLSGRLGRLRERLSGFGWVVGDVLDKLSRDDQVVSQDLFEVHLESWIKGRVVLLGDAAHAMTPSLRQGAGMAIEDAVSLASAIGSVGDESPSDALLKWHARRRRRVDWVQSQSHRISKAVHWHSDLAQSLRDTAIKASPVEWMTAGLESLLEDEIFDAKDAYSMGDRPLRVLIVGAGMAGLMLAGALEEFGIAAELTERQTSRRTHQSGVILYPNALRALRSMGVDMDGGGGRALRYFEVTDMEGRRLDKIALSSLDPGPYNWQAISYDGLIDRLLSPGIESRVRFDERIAELEERPDGVHVRFMDGAREVYDLVVGADGVRSQVRRLVFGLNAPLYTGISSWIFVIPDPLGHLDGVLEMWGAGKRLGFAPMGGGQMLGYASFRTPENTPDPVSGRLERFRERFMSFGGVAPALLMGLVKNEQLLHQDQEEVLQQRWVHERVALIGDAAHAMTPELGQGTAMAAEDALALAKCVGSGDPLNEALLRYERQRKERVEHARAESRAMAKLSHRKSWLSVALRSGVMRASSMSAVHQGLAAVLQGDPEG